MLPHKCALPFPQPHPSNIYFWCYLCSLEFNGPKVVMSAIFNGSTLSRTNIGHNPKSFFMYIKRFVLWFANPFQCSYCPLVSQISGGYKCPTSLQKVTRGPGYIPLHLSQCQGSIVTNEVNSRHGHANGLF